TFPGLCVVSGKSSLASAMAAAPGKCFLVTGPPGVGKTTLVMRVLESLRASHPDLRVRGFYTREVREGSQRVGFEVVTLDGRRGPLAVTSASRWVSAVLVPYLTYFFLFLFVLFLLFGGSG
ncbi:hypothetical protein Taro_019088, partial [Colocasia esculenta]|nr:hypothetical protein [Colocasia esculenta]